MHRASLRLRVCAVLCLLAAPAAAQQVEVIHSDSLRRADSLRARADSIRDTTIGKGRGLPRQPSRSFPEPDSIIRALMIRPGFRALRYAADSVELLAPEREVRLVGKGLTAREGSTLESDTIFYIEKRCTVLASGGPRLFDTTGVVIGQGMQYDACNKTGLVASAKTDLAFQGGTWYVLGHMAFDNKEDRVYAGGATMTTCELPDPHYHFATKEVKWVNKRLMVARPAVLYVEDVPIAWLPFVFQDTRHGRRSGILSPGIGVNDIVRTPPGYQRHLTNLGYYWAISDYMDAQASIDWYSGVQTLYSARLRYRWLDRFLAGGISYSELRTTTGVTSQHIAWSHQQQFSLNSSLTANIDYATSSQIISRNSLDPALAIGTIDSRLNYQTRTAWGQFNIGGSRTQSLDKSQVATTFPSVSFSPNPVAISRAVTWSPSLTFTNSLLQNGSPGFPVALGTGLIDTVGLNSRNSSFNFSTPLRIGTWTLPLSIAGTDQWSNARSTTTDTAAHTVKTFGEQFSTTLDWNTGVGLPVVFQGTWNLSPSVSMANTAGGAYAVRNQFTGGRFVTQGKRFQFTLNSSPTLFALLPGFGPITRIRHAISPSFSWSYAPAASLPEAYARAVNQGQIPAAGLRQPPRQAISFGLSQNFEAKLRPPPRPAGDTTRRTAGDTLRPPGAAPAGGAPGAAGSGAGGQATQPEEGRKIKLLSLQTSGMSYDFEQAKLPGRTGWTTQTMDNTISSDLMQGLSFHITHDLWDGPVGYRGVHLRPSLTSVAFGLSLGPTAVNIVRSLLGLSPGAPVVQKPDSSLLQPPSPTNPGSNITNAFQRGPLATQFSAIDRLSPARGGPPFTASLNFSFQRSRKYDFALGPNGALVPDSTAAVPANSMVSGQMSFSPTAHWTVSWSTSYNFTTGAFSDHVVRLDRDLHDWRATFSFVKSPNGNVSFTFNIVLIPEPDLKMDYESRTIR